MEKITQITFRFTTDEMLMIEELKDYRNIKTKSKLIKKLIKENYNRIN